MANEVDLKKMLADLDVILGNTDLSDVSSDSTGFQELPEGYYLVEVEKAELKTSKTSGQPMVAFQTKIVDDGLDVEIDEKGDVKIGDIKGTKNRKIFKHYVLKDDSTVRRFVADMLKFEGEKAGEPLLPKEAFLSSETLEDALDVLIGMRLYMQVSISENNNGEKSVWQNFVSWKRANALELPV